MLPEHKNINAKPNVFIHVDEFVPIYVVYHKVTRQRSLNAICLGQCLPRAMEKLHLGQGKPLFKMLSIGSGDGVVDQEIVRIVEEGYLNADHMLEEVEILNTAVEPHPLYVKQYKDAIETRMQGQSVHSPKKRSIKFNFEHVSIEEYMKSNHDKNQYDVVHAIHSLYYVVCPETTLNHCYHNELGEKGLIVACLIDENNISAKLVSMLNKNRPEDKKISYRQSESVALIAAKHGWQFERIAVPFLVDITEIFEKTPEGNRLLEFFVHEENFLESASTVEIAKVYSLLKELSTKDDQGRLVAESSNEVILIYKM